MDQKPDLTRPSLIREDIDETREALTEKLETLEDQLRNTVENAKQTVEGTIENVKTSIRHLSPSYQVSQRPLLMVGGAVATGVLAGRLLKRRQVSAVEHRSRLGSFEDRTAVPMTSEYEDAELEFPRPPRREPPRRIEPRGPSLLDRFTHQFHDEIQMVKGMVLTGALNAAGQWAKKTAPPRWTSHIDDVLGSAVRKLGTQSRR